MENCPASIRWTIWKERNSTCFENLETIHFVQSKLIEDDIFLKGITTMRISVKWITVTAKDVT